MNDDAGIQLVNGYLDGVLPQEDGSALAFAIEGDAELLRLLCEYGWLEAGLQDIFRRTASGERQSRA